MNVLIVGGGKVGAHLAHLLRREQHEVCIIELRATRVAQLRTELPQDAVVDGSGSDPDTLERAGVRTAHVVAAMTGDDAVNLVVTNLARVEFGVPRVIGRVVDPRNAWLYTPDMGVDVAVDQADIIAHLIAEEMSLGDMLTLFKLRKGQFSLVEEKVHPTSAANGRAVHELALPEDCVLTAVIRQGDLIVPRGNTVLQAADEVLALVHSSQISRLAALLAPAAD
ncbi:MAG: TrkA family potassium uptake protein [Caldilineaceae bacterium]|nr:TrkA family potassium uptake protein [Caldilineaceae bacterium]